MYASERASSSGHVWRIDIMSYLHVLYLLLVLHIYEFPLSLRHVQYLQ